MLRPEITIWDIIFIIGITLMWFACAASYWAGRFDERKENFERAEARRALRKSLREKRR